MTAEALLSVMTQLGFVLIFLSVLRNTLREPRTVNLRATAFFSIPAILVSIGWLTQVLGMAEDPAPTALTLIQSVLLVSWSYPLILLASSFTSVPRPVVYVAALGLAFAIAALVLSQGNPSPILAIPIILNFVVTVGYASMKFMMAASLARGIPRKRLRAAALGSAFLAMLMLSFLPVSADPDGPWVSVSSLLSMAAAVSYYLAFMPPAFLRDLWMAGEVRRFITEAVVASPQARADLTALVTGMEVSVGRIVGAPTSLVTVNPQTQELESLTDAGLEQAAAVDAETTVVARSFQQQRAIFEDDPVRHDPANAAMYRAYGARGVMAVPMTLAERRFGVLATTLDRPPLFAEDDLRLLMILADRLAVVLQSHEALREGAELEAQRASLQLKDEFLAAVAHDLKTPLTTLLGQSQLMNRWVQRDPSLNAHREHIESMVTAAQRMQRLVDDLLDAARADQIGFVGTIESVELLGLVQEAARVFDEQAQRIRVEGEPTSAMVDRERITQVVTNLLDNALKYSPVRSIVQVRVGSDGADATVSIADEGVGIASADLPVIFERFRRGSGPREQRSSGLGLGLYICQRIAEDHGGAITVSSKLGEGSIFTLTLPIEPHGDVSEGL